MRMVVSSNQTVNVLYDTKKVVSLRDQIRQDWDNKFDDCCWMFFDVKEYKHHCMLVMHKTTFASKIYPLPLALARPGKVLKGVAKWVDPTTPEKIRFIIIYSDAILAWDDFETADMGFITIRAINISFCALSKSSVRMNCLSLQNNQKVLGVDFDFEPNTEEQKTEIPLVSWETGQTLKVKISNSTAPDLDDIQQIDISNKDHKKSVIEAYKELWKSMFDDVRVESFRVTNNCCVIAVLNEIGVS